MTRINKVRKAIKYITGKEVTGDFKTIGQLLDGFNKDCEENGLKIPVDQMPDGYPKTENKLIIDATGAEWSSSMGYTADVSPVDSFVPFIKGNKYIVEMDGESKEVVCGEKGRLIVFMSDNSIDRSSGTNDYSIYAMNYQPSGLKVTAVDALITPLDEKFIPPLSSVTLKSSTEGSSKKFKVTVNDSGTLSATEITG